MTRVLVTGAGGTVGRAFLAECGGMDVIATDLRPPPTLPDGVRFRAMDVTTADPDRVIADERPDTVVHLASIVTPGVDRATAYEVDVSGTARILKACLSHGVRRLVVTSSGAAYGYHPDNPVPLRETDPLRGNPEFPYADHKRRVEEMLAETRDRAPELEQVVLRIGTVMGAGVDNQITALFRKPRLIALSGSDSPFCFIWIGDLARILMRAATNGPPGIYNVAGDGQMSIDALARDLGKPVLRVPAALLETVLRLARPLGLSRYGPEQVRFLRYRPLLANDALKRDFGYRPEKTGPESFDEWKRGAGL